jgi:hypothetical protein
MAKINVINEKPAPPPIKEVQITLTEAESRKLSALLGSGVTAEALDLLGLKDLYNKLQSKFPFERLPFRADSLLRKKF